MVSLSLLLFVGGDSQGLRQSQTSVTRGVRKTARIQCHVSTESFSSVYIHWYRQMPEETPERILYFSSEKPVFDKDADKRKFEAEKELTESTCTLTIKTVNQNDSATYYCAYWDDTMLAKH